MVLGAALLAITTIISELTPRIGSGQIVQNGMGHLKGLVLELQRLGPFMYDGFQVFIHCLQRFVLLIQLVVEEALFAWIRSYCSSACRISSFRFWSFQGLRKNL